MTQQQGSVTDEDRNFVETWEKVSVGQQTIYKLDSRGDLTHETINAGRRFMLTTEERMVNQERIVGEEDPFVNGAFRPVVVPSSVTVESNPNALSDEEIVKIFKASDLAWSERMKTIDSAATIRRMMDLAEANDISLRRYKELERLYDDVNPRRLTYTDPHLRNFLPDHKDPGAPSGGGTGANTAKDGGGNPRRQGGRSSDYR